MASTANATIIEVSSEIARVKKSPPGSYSSVENKKSPDRASTEAVSLESLRQDTVRFVLATDGNSAQ